MEFEAHREQLSRLLDDEPSGVVARRTRFAARPRGAEPAPGAGGAGPP